MEDQPPRFRNFCVSAGAIGRADPSRPFALQGLGSWLCKLTLPLTA